MLIHYKAYSFTQGGKPVSVREYLTIAGMNDEAFGEYIRELRASLWERFREDEKNATIAERIFVVCLVLLVLCIVLSPGHEERGLPGAVIAWGVVLSVGGFLCAFPLTMTKTSFRAYVRHLVSYLKKHRRIILKTKTYDQYLSTIGVSDDAHPLDY